MPRSKFGRAVAASVPLRISAKDIVAMDYWLNEAPIADPSRQNAICFALKRLLPEGSEVFLRAALDGEEVEAVVNNATVLSLSRELSGWWHRVLVGHRAVPVAGHLEIPLDLLAPGIQTSALEPAKRPVAHPWAAELPHANAA